MLDSVLQRSKEGKHRRSLVCCRQRTASPISVYYRWLSGAHGLLWLSIYFNNLFTSLRVPIYVGTQCWNVSSTYKSLYLEGCATMPTLIFQAWATYASTPVCGLNFQQPNILWKQAVIKSKMHKPSLIGNAQMLVVYLSLIDDIIYSLSQQSYLSIFFFTMSIFLFKNLFCYRCFPFLVFPLLRASISSCCDVSFSFIPHRWSLIIDNCVS